MRNTAQGGWWGKEWKKNTSTKGSLCEGEQPAVGGKGHKPLCESAEI